MQTGKTEELTSAEAWKTLLEEPQRTSSSIATKNSPKGLGVRTHPCFTLFVIGNGSVRSPSKLSLPAMPSWNCQMMLINLSSNFQRAAWLTVSNALVRSRNTTYKDWCCWQHFTCNCWMTKIMSIVFCWAWKLHCNSAHCQWFGSCFGQEGSMQESCWPWRAKRHYSNSHGCSLCL